MINLEELEINTEVYNRVQYIKRKISNIFDVVYDKVINEVEEDENYKTNKDIKLICFDLIIPLIQHDFKENISKFAHDNGLSLLLENIADPEFTERLLTLVSTVVEKYVEFIHSDALPQEKQTIEKTKIIKKIVESTMTSEKFRLNSTQSFNFADF